MKKETVRDLSAVIKAHTERRSLEELAAAGKRHFRVVSGRKVMELIQAIVDDAIEREALELVEKDRDRVVDATRREFDRVLRFQAEQEAEIRESRERAERLERRLAEARETQAAREARLVAGSMRRIQEAEQGRAEARNEAEEAGRRAARAEADLEEVRRHLEEAGERIRGLEEEQRLLAARFEGERGELAGRQEQVIADLRRRLEESEAARAAAERRRARTERALRRMQARSARELAEAREASDAGAVSRLREDLKELRSLVDSLADRPAGLDEDSIHTLVARLGEREEQIEGRFSFRMDETLEEITRALRAATASPIDDRVEATDVLVDRVFDREGEMRTNLDVLTVEELVSEDGITSNLELLKAARKGDETETRTERS